MFLHLTPIKMTPLWLGNEPLSSVVECCSHCSKSSTLSVRVEVWQLALEGAECLSGVQEWYWKGMRCARIGFLEKYREDRVLTSKLVVAIEDRI